MYWLGQALSIYSPDSSGRYLTVIVSFCMTGWQEHK
jgi:hypothetical protein